MRNYAKSIYITAPLTLIALIAAVLLHYCAKGTGAEFWCNVCLGIFGSGLLTALVSCVGYAYEKKKTMEGFYFTTLQILRTLDRYDLSWSRNRKISFLLDFCDTDKFSWDAYYGDIYFLFDFSRSQSNYVYERIYLPIIQFYDGIDRNAFHLELYRDGDVNNSAVVDKKIAKIESMLISKEQRDMEWDGEKSTVTSIKYILTDPIHEELDGRYYDLMYGKSCRRAK